MVTNSIQSLLNW